jgi:peptidyl-prolyl cis-trans isomerase D
MLKKIRGSADHSIFKILFIILAIIFAISLGDFSSSKGHVVAIVGDEEITLSDFLQASHGADENMPEQQRDLFNYEIVVKLVTQSLIKQEAERLGIKIDPELAINFIKNDSRFYKDGVFDIETYKTLLEYNHLKEDTLLDTISSQIASKFLLDSLVASLPIKANLSNYLYSYLAEKRNVSLVSADMSKKNLKSVSDKELEEFYQKHKDSFRGKEYRSFSYLFIDPKEKQKQFTVLEEDLIKEYEENKEEYSLPETRDLYHFLAPNKEVASEVANLLKSGRKPEEVAKEFVGRKVIAEVFKNQPEQSFLSSLDLSLFNLHEDESTMPIKSELGWHVFKILKVNHRQYKDFSVAKKEIEENLRYKLSEIELNDLLKNIEDEVASGADFAEISKKNGVSFKNYNKISRDNKDIEVINLVFELSEKEESDIITLEDGKGYALVKIDEIFPERALEFKEAKEAVKSQYLDELKITVTQEIANLLKDKATEIVIDNKLNTKSIDKLLHPIYQKHQISDLDKAVITIDSQEISRPEVSHSNLPVALVNNAFNTSANHTSQVEKLATAKYAFAIVNNIIADGKLAPNIDAQISKMSEVNYKNEIYDQYINYLKKKYNVETYFNVIKDYQNQS